MPFEVTCGQCQGRLLIESGGVTVACPMCGTHLAIPREADPAYVPPPVVAEAKTAPVDSAVPATSPAAVPSVATSGAETSGAATSGAATSGAATSGAATSGAETPSFDFLQQPTEASVAEPPAFPDFAAISAAAAASSAVSTPTASPAGVPTPPVSPPPLSPPPVSPAPVSASGVSAAALATAPEGWGATVPVAVDADPTAAFAATNAPPLTTPDLSPLAASTPSAAVPIMTVPEAEVATSDAGAFSAAVTDILDGSVVGPKSNDPPTVITTEAVIAAQAASAAAPPFTATAAAAALAGISLATTASSSPDRNWAAPTAPAAPPSLVPAELPSDVVPKQWLILVAGYASAATLVLVYLLFQLMNTRQHQLESLPDLEPPRSEGKVGWRIAPPGPPVAPGHELQLGESQRFGNLRVTPVKITREPIEFEHAFGNRRGQRPATAPVLKLWLRFENVSRDQEIPPLSSILLFRRTFDRGQMRANQFLGPLEEVRQGSGLHFVYDMPEHSEFVLRGQDLDRVLKPGEAFETYIPAEEGIAEVEGPWVWRVHFRKGYNPRSGRGVTTLIEVAFDGTALSTKS